MGAGISKNKVPLPNNLVIANFCFLGRKYLIFNFTSLGQMSEHLTGLDLKSLEGMLTTHRPLKHDKPFSSTYQ